MAVVQISRIQVRRGQKNQGSGLPQLASGELGWAIDTREMYVGNGAVSEGAPAVGNTKILTQYDNIFALANSYAYRADDAFIQTGSTSVSPVLRTLQDRLDDRVSVRSFGVTGDSSQAAKVPLQRAIDQLYLNSATKGSEKSRVVLHLEAGIYSIDGTVYIPPNATIKGAGVDKTVIRCSASAAILQTVNDSSTVGSYADDSSSTFNNQARNITISDLTLESTTGNLGLNLVSCRNSLFENIKIIGTWSSGDTIDTSFDTNIGLRIDSLSGAVESSNNKFVNCAITKWGYGIMSNFDINHNVFDRCNFEVLGNGVNFGVDMILGSPAQGREKGPSNNIVCNCKFFDVNRYGIWIENGEYNTSKGNSFESVGNEGGTEAQAVYSILKFNKNGNQSINDYFARTKALSYDPLNLYGKAYVPEIEGVVDYTSGYHHSLSFNQALDPGTRLFKLPGFGHQSFILDYHMVSSNYEMQRVGQIKISVEPRATPSLMITDDYDFTGDVTYEDSISFTAAILDEDSDLTNDSIGVNVISNMPSNDTTTIRFTIKVVKSNIA